MMEHYLGAPSGSERVNTNTYARRDMGAPRSGGRGAWGGVPVK